MPSSPTVRRKPWPPPSWCASAMIRCPRCSTQEALKPARRRHETYPGIISSITTNTTIRSCASAMSRRRSAPPITAGGALPDFAIEHASTETTPIAAPDPTPLHRAFLRAGLFFSLDTTAKILSLNPTGSLIAVRRWRLWARSIRDRAAGVLGAILTRRPVRYVLGREEESNSARRGGRAHVIRTV